MRRRGETRMTPYALCLMPCPVSRIPPYGALGPNTTALRNSRFVPRA